MDIFSALFGMNPSLAFMVASLMTALSGFDQIWFYLLFISLVIWCVGRSAGVRLALLLVISGSFNCATGFLFNMPGSYGIKPGLIPDIPEYSSKFPSSIAQNAVVFFGFIMESLRSIYVSLICLLFIILIGISRISMNVNSPGDIISGWILGSLILVIFVLYETRFVFWLTSKSLPSQIIGAFLCSLLVIIIPYLALLYAGSGFTSVPWDQSIFARVNEQANFLLLRYPVMISGLFFGFLAGDSLCIRITPFREDGSLFQLTGRYLVGILILAAIWFLSGLLMHLSAGVFPWYLSDYIRPMLAAFWITTGAPYLFLKVGLAKRSE